MRRAEQRVARVLFAAFAWVALGRGAAAQGVTQTIAGGGATGFCGEGLRASLACMDHPVGISFDPDGFRYIADLNNNRIRRITPGGVISTFAGNGIRGSSGENGPAAQAAVGDPCGIFAEPASRAVYIAECFSSTIRKVTPNGIITTVAGSGVAGFSGDGGPATAARLSLTTGNPAGIAVFAGSLYITDNGNGRIRRVDPNGIITTVAGGGAGGDNVPAVQAFLNNPSGPVAFDASGNFYIAELGAHRIRRVSNNGMIATVAGTGIAGFSGDGGSATLAMLNRPSGVARDASGALFIADRNNSRIRRVGPEGGITTVAGGGRTIISLGIAVDSALSTDLTLGFPEAVAADSQALLVAMNFPDRVLGFVGAYARPGSVSITPDRMEFQIVAGSTQPVSQRLTLFSSDLIPFGFSARANTAAGGNWLSVAPALGTTPGGIQVTVNPSGMIGVATYAGSVTLTVPQAVNPSLTIPVSVIVTNPPPRLSVAPLELSFSTVQGSDPDRQQLRIINSGGGTLPWSAVTAGPQANSPVPSWLSLPPSSGSGNTTVAVEVNTTGLSPGLYQGQILVRSGSDTRRVAVILQVSAAGPVLETSYRGVQSAAVEGAGQLFTRNFAVLNSGSGSLKWSAEILDIIGGNWLTISPTSGTSTAGQPPPSVIVTPNATGLRAGAYSALLRISSLGAANSPQLLTAVLNVLPQDAATPLAPLPFGLPFLASAGGPPPPTQQVRVLTNKSTPVSFTASGTEQDDSGWLSVSPTSGTASIAAPGLLTVRVDSSALSAGIYRGFVNVSLSDGTSPSVNILLVVAPQGGLAAAAAGDAGSTFSPLATPAADACAPTRLAVLHTTLLSNFSTPVGWPLALNVRPYDDCGKARTDATVVTTFSNGDPPIVLVNQHSGLYSGTWIPGTATAGVTVTSTAVVPGLKEGSAQTTGTSTANLTPRVFSGGAVNGASFTPGQPLALGAMVSIFGANLTTAQTFASTIPLPTELGSVSAKLGDIHLPLYFSGSGQINAQVPFELPAGSTAPLVLRAGNAFTVPELIHLVTAQPGIFTLNNAGTGPGAILDANFALVSANNPVRTGRMIQIFAAGLGPTDPKVASGTVSPGSPPAITTRPVTATVGGISAPVVFAGLAPGFVGLYQVNVQVPAGVRNGEVPVVLSQDGVDSNAGTIFIQN